jgi:hypothetical protein
MYFRKIRQLAEIPAEPGDKSDSKKAPGCPAAALEHAAPAIRRLLPPYFR